MTTDARAALRSHTHLTHAALLLLFAVGGCAALICEIVWLQILELFIGSSSVSLGILLGTFMGGMSVGSLLVPRLVSERAHPFRTYAALELLIGASGVLLLWILPAVGRLYLGWAVDGLSSFLLRGAAAAVCLLPPTIAMGATLPIVARRVEQSPGGVAWVGWLYAASVAGGVIGCLLAGFYLLPVHDMATASLVAAALNGVVGAGALTLRRYPGRDGLSASHAPRSTSDNDHRPQSPAVVLTGIAVSGFCALAAQVVWTRILALALGPTVYTFSIVLAAFLIGLSAGGTAGAAAARRLADSRRSFAWCQFAAAASIVWAGFVLARVLPYWPPVAPGGSALERFTFDFFRAVSAVLPATIAWGASFPLAIACLPSPDRARAVARVYAANTAGAICGALAASLFLVSAAGSRETQRALILLSAAGGVLLLARRPDATRTDAVSARGVVQSLVPLFVAGALALSVSGIPGVLVAYGRYSANWVGRTGDIIYAGEGLNAFVAVSRLSGGVLAYHNAGKIQASSQPQDMRLQRLLGHVSTLVHADPSNVLVIGCGSGITAGAAAADPRVARLTIVEIERLVPGVVSTYFHLLNFDVVRNPKARIRIDDARHYLLTRSETFDVITADPFDPWVRGAAALYTKEFFEAARARLNPGGIVTMWVPLYTTRMDAVKSELATFFEVFPDAFVLGNTYQEKGNDLVLVGQRERGPIVLDEIGARLQQPGFETVMQSMSQVGFRSARDLFSGYVGRAADLRPWLSGAVINRDWNLRLQYLAGLGFTTNEPDVIYQEMLRYRRPLLSR